MQVRQWEQSCGTAELGVGCGAVYPYVYVVRIGPGLSDFFLDLRRERDLFLLVLRQPAYFHGQSVPFWAAQFS